MKNFLKSFCLLLLSFVLVSCATVEKTPVTGKWVAKTDSGEKVYLFSADGKFAYEDSSNDDYDFGNYEITGENLICNDTSYTVVIDGNKLLIDGVKYKKTTSKVVNNSDSVAGVWQMSDSENEITLAFTDDGAVLCAGTYYNSGSYSVDPENNILDVKISHDYLILNDTLYIDLFTFASFYKVEKLTRVTSKGENQAAEKLVSINGWWYLQKNSDGMSGTQYYFYENGGFWAIELVDAVVQQNISGTYEFNYPYTVELSTGDKLVFCVVDGYPFGFTI